MNYIKKLMLRGKGILILQVFYYNITQVRKNGKGYLDFLFANYDE